MAESIKRPKNSRSWWWLRTDVDLDRPSVTADLSLRQLLGNSKIITAVFLFTPILHGVLLRAAFGDNDEPFLEGVASMLLIALALYAAIAAPIVFLAVLQRRRITISTSSVTVERFGLFGRSQWSLPITAYRGVLRRVVTPWFRTRLHIIELLHADPDKTAPLFVQEKIDKPRERLKAFAARLGRPALQISGDEIVALNVGNIPRPAGKQGRPGEGDRSQRPGQETPPEGLSVTEDTIDGDAARKIAITASPIPFWFMATAWGVFTILAISLAILFHFFDDAGWMGVIRLLLLGITGILLLSLVIATWVIGGAERKILVSRSRLVVVDVLQVSDGIEESVFRLAELEDIRIKKESSEESTLLIAGPREQIEVGKGLSDEALQWLRDYLMAAAARA